MFEKSKNVKRFVSISAAALCMITSLKVAPYSVLSTDAAGDTLTAFEITEEMKIGWNLGNTMDATASALDEEGNPYTPEHAGLETETAWGQPKANQAIFDAIKAKGFNTVRIPTTWFQHLDEENNIDPEWLARVHEVVDYAYKNDMYVILNVHHENWINRKDLLTAYDDIQPRLMKIWTQVAEEFKDYDQHLVFECMNEPRAVGTEHEWWSPTAPAESEVINKLEADFVNLIRSTDGPYAKTRLLMLPGYCASADTNIISDLVIPDDDYVAVSIHAYTPYNFTMNTDESTGAFHDTFTTTFSNDLAATLDNLREAYLDKDIPIVIGEFGSSNFGNTQARIDWATQYITTAKKYGIPCVLWDNDARTNKDLSERHDYMNRRTLEWYEDSVQVVDTMMNILADDSIVWGSERHIPEIKVTHQAYEEGTMFYEGPLEIDASKEKTYGNTTPGGDGEVTWDQLEGKEVAIKFTGATPLLCFSDAEYGGWTENKPYVVDEENGTAYYLMESAAKAWGDDPATIAHMQAKTPKVTTIESIVILNAPEGDIDLPAETAEIHKLKFSDVDRSKSLEFTIEGPAGTKTQGALGYMGAEEWQQIPWSGTVGDDGKLVVTIEMKDVPETVQAGEFQIWDNFDIVEMTGYKVADDSVVIIDPTDDTVWGDADGNGDVRMNDAVLIMQSLSNPDRFGVDGTEPSHITVEGQLRADVYENTGNGSITPQDALLIQEFLLKKVATLAPAK